jgi:hypothetical protein
VTLLCWCVGMVCISRRCGFPLVMMYSTHVLNIISKFLCIKGSRRLGFTLVLVIRPPEKVVSMGHIYLNLANMCKKRIASISSYLGKTLDQHRYSIGLLFNFWCGAVVNHQHKKVYFFLNLMPN